MKIEDFIHNFKEKLKIEIAQPSDKRLWVTIPHKELREIVTYIKMNNFEHLSTISATDWLEENSFEITYHFWSYTYKVALILKTKIIRDIPVIDSINHQYGTNAESCEREIHEMFGIRFTGNSDLSPLFLEDWEGLPPFRKDFDWRHYVRENLYDKSNNREKGYFED
jgi:NADH-quinone oxidoreductase subunit C